MQKISSITSAQNKPLLDDDGSLLSKIEDGLTKKKARKVKYLEQAEMILHQMIPVCQNEEVPSLSVSDNTLPHTSNNQLIIVEKNIAPSPLPSDTYEGGTKNSKLNKNIYVYSPPPLYIEKAGEGSNISKQNGTIMDADGAHQTLANYNKYQAINTPHLTPEKGVTLSLSRRDRHEEAMKDSNINKKSNAYSPHPINVEKTGEGSNDSEQNGTIVDDENNNSKSITLYYTQTNDNVPMNEEHTGENLNSLKGNYFHFKNDINKNTEKKSEKLIYHFKQWSGKHSVMINKNSEGLVLMPSDELVEKRLTNALESDANINKWGGNKNKHEKHNERNENSDKDLD